MKFCEDYSNLGNGYVANITMPCKSCLFPVTVMHYNFMSNLLFQKILGSDGAFRSHLQYFGRSLDGFEDLNGDSITDVSIGAFGQVVQLW